MKKLAVVLVFLAACHNSNPSAPATGASSPEAAVTTFVGAAKAQNLDAMSAVWGDAKHLVRDTEDRAVLEKRELTIIKLLCQDSYRVASKTLGLNGHQVIQLEAKKGAKTGLIKFTTVMGPGGRWYVEDIDTVALMDFCKPS